MSLSVLDPQTDIHPKSRSYSSHREIVRFRLLFVPINEQPTRSVMGAVPRSEVINRDLDEPMRCCTTAYGEDFRTDFVVPKPGKEVDPRYVVECADDDTVREPTLLAFYC